MGGSPGDPGSCMFCSPSSDEGSENAAPNPLLMALWPERSELDEVSAKAAPNPLLVALLSDQSESVEGFQWFGSGSVGGLT